LEIGVDLLPELQNDIITKCARSAVQVDVNAYAHELQETSNDRMAIWPTSPNAVKVYSRPFYPKKKHISYLNFQTEMKRVYINSSLTTGNWH